MSKTLYMLIGPKGSGKTYIGTLAEKKLGIPFLRVETIWLSLKPNEKGWEKIEETIDDAFLRTDKVMVEHLGAGHEFNHYLNSLQTKYTVQLIRIFSDLTICLERVKNRSNSDHIPVSDSKVEEYNKIAAQVKLNWSLEIDNNGPATDEAILRAIQNL